MGSHLLHASRQLSADHETCTRSKCRIACGRATPRSPCLGSCTSRLLICKTMQRHSICSRFACLVRIRLLLRHGTHRKPCVSHHARIIKIKLALMAGTSSGLSGVQRCSSIRPIDRYCCLHSTLAGITIVHVRTRGMFHVSAASGARTRMLRSAFNVSYLIHARLPIGWRLLCGIPDCAAPYPPSLPASSMHRSYLSSCRCRSQEFAWMRF